MKKTLLYSTIFVTALAPVSALAEEPVNEEFAQAYEFNTMDQTAELAAIEPAAGDGGAQNHDSFADALTGGKVDISFRYRLADVDDDAFADDSEAGTLQTMIGYRTGSYKNTSAYVQFRDVTVIGPDDYNDSINGQTTRPPEVDPDATEIDQAYLDFNVIPDTRVTIGRRKLKWGNRRYVAALGWRQNNRSFDGFVVENKSIPDTELHYAFANNVNRAGTDDSPVGNFDEDTRVHMLNARYSGLPIGTITGYGYWLDLDGATPAAGLSSKTYGINLTGKQTFNDVDFGYVLEYADQSDHGDNPTNYDTEYYRIEPSLSYAGFTLKAGYEELGSDSGTAAFTTPLALLHAFNGWADKFGTTPANGLEDTYASLTYKWKGDGEFFNGGKFHVAYHEFEADSGGADYGEEFDAVAGVKFLDHYGVALKYADYDADTFAADTQKVWLILTAKF